jgi:hypothetical protein
MPNLSTDDRRAIDVILMNGQTNSTQAAPTAASDGLAARIDHVASFLRVLDLMPAEEPPADLTQRTLQRIRTSAHVPTTAGDRPQAPAPAVSDQNIA